jgi:hypothetical protein
MKRGLLLGAAQILLVLTMVGKYGCERAKYPRVWAAVVPVDPNLPMRGRYLSLRLLVNNASTDQTRGFLRCRLAVEDGRLIAHPDPHGPVTISYFRDRWIVDKPLAFFMSEHAPDPTREFTAQPLFAQVTVPPKSDPRPIRLAVAKNGRLVPLR